MNVTIYGIPGSPYVRAAQLGCEEKSVAYDFRHMNFGDSKSPEHLARHPFGRIPAFEHDGFALYETQAILRYIDAVFPGPALQPPEPRAAARMNQFVGICDWYFFPQVSATIAFQRLIKPMMGGTTDEDACAAAYPNAVTCMHEIARLLGDGPYLAGAQLTIADLMLAPHMAFFAMTPEGGLLADAPNVAAWVARMDARDSMRKTDFFPKAKAA
ncbi:MAG TPA: glutathione S-transferase family protein [Pseudolabrys sp.]|jgi:glutathione S-transferase